MAKLNKEKRYKHPTGLYREVELQKDDSIEKICDAAKMGEKELEAAYYHEVNVNGPNGIHSERNEKWPPEFKEGKIFYVPTLKTLNKRRNQHVVSNLTTSIRCMYGKDEPMRNRFILFWEVDDSGNGFRPERTGAYYGRKGDTKPVGLGTTDGNGFLNGESLLWISDGDSNSIGFSKNKIPEHVKEKVLKFKATIDIYDSDKDQYIPTDFYHTIGSKYKHGIYSVDYPLYDFGNGNFIWAKKVSRFIKFYKYAFVPLPVDIIPEKSFQSIDLETISKEYFEITIPKENSKNDFVRQFYTHNKESINNSISSIRSEIRNDSKQFEEYFEIPSGKNYNRNKLILIPPKIEEYKTPEMGFTLIEDKKKRPSGPRYVKPKPKLLIKEKTPEVKEVTFKKFTLPEWIARINQCIRDTEIQSEIFKKKAKHYTDVIYQLSYIGKLAKVAAKFPYGDSDEHIKNDALGPLLLTTDLTEEISKNFIKQVKKCKDKDFKDETFKKANEVFEAQALTLFNMINNEDFAKEIVYYFDLNVTGMIDKRPAEWKHILNLSSDSEKKKHLTKMAENLHLMFESAYSVIKDTDIFNIGADKTNSVAWKAYNQVKKAYKCMDESSIKDKSPFGLVLYHTVGGSNAKKPFEEFFKEKFENPFMQSVFAPSMLVQIFKIFGMYASETMFEKRVVDPIADKIVEIFKKLQFKTYELAEKVTKIFKNSSNEKKTFREIISTQVEKKYLPSLDTSCSGFVFILSLINLIDNFKSNKEDTVKQMVVFASDSIGLYDSALGLFNIDRDMMGNILVRDTAGKLKINGSALKKLHLNAKALGCLGCAISAGLALREVVNATDDKTIAKASFDFVFAIISLSMVFGPAGWIPALIFAGTVMALQALLDWVIFGGPVERTVYNLCKDLEKSKGFILIKEDTENYIKYKDLLTLTGHYKDSNKQLSWRAVVPLISMGYVIQKKNKKKREIDYKKTEEHLKNIVKNYPEIQYTANRRWNRKTPKVGKGYTIKEILDIYDSLYKKSLQLKPKERLEGKTQVMIDLNNLRNGCYDGKLDGKRVSRYPLHCGEISLKGFVQKIRDSEKVPSRRNQYKVEKKELRLNEKNSKIVIYDIFYNKVVSASRKYGGSVKFNEETVHSSHN